MRGLTKTSAQYIYIYISGVIRRVGRLLSAVGSKSGCEKRLCKRTVRLLLVLTMVVFSVVPAMAQPDGLKGAEEVSLSADLVVIAEQFWNPGEVGVPLYNFYQHYKRHRVDRGIEVKSPSDYLQQAVAMYHDTMANPDDYRVGERFSKETCVYIYKYTNPETKAFILHDRKGKIYTYGGAYHGGKHHAKRNARRLAELTQQNNW